MTMRAAVTSAVPTVGLAGGAIQTAAYTWAAGDLGNCLILNPASAISQALPTPTGSSGNFANGWNASVENVSGSVVTLTVPSGVSLDGVSNGSAKLQPNSGCRFFTDGANWYTTRGLSNGGGVGLKPAGVLFATGSPVTLTGTTARTLLVPMPIPAGTLSDGGMLRLTIQMGSAGTGGTKGFAFNMGGLDFLSSGIGATSFGAALQIVGVRRGATFVHEAALVPSNNISSNTLVRAIDMSQAQTLNVYGTLTTGTDTLVIETVLLEILNQ